jgi:hypothetical protein
MILSSDMLFLLLGAASLVFLLIYGLIRNLSGKKGSWHARIPVSSGPVNQRATESSQGERRARAYLEKRFQRPFPSTRPDFLNNDVTKANMEIDCYNADLKLGVEYNGRQHYEYVPFFHATRESFHNQAYRDRFKKMYCAEQGVELIVIPYTELAHLEDWLEAELDKRGFSS